MPQEVAWLLPLAGTVLVFSAFMYVLTGAISFQRLLRDGASWPFRVLVTLLFGALAIYSTYTGTRLPSGAIINVRDLGPMLAGLAGGPLVGLGAGLIGGAHRYFLGGLTAVPCAIATSLAGLLAGLIHRLSGGLVGFWWAVLFAALMECIHMGLILLIAQPSSEAAAVVSQIAFPMILANSVGMAIGHVFMDRRAYRRAAL